MICRKHKWKISLANHNFPSFYFTLYGMWLILSIKELYFLPFQDFCCLWKYLRQILYRQCWNKYIFHKYAIRILLKIAIFIIVNLVNMKSITICFYYAMNFFSYLSTFFIFLMLKDINCIKMQLLFLITIINNPY